MKKQKNLFSMLVLGSFLSVSFIYGYADRHMSGNNMRIITTPKYAKIMDKYIDWKIERGLDVEVDILSAEKGTKAILQKLQEKYNEEGLTYIVLVGDIDDIPSVMLAGYPSDPSYTLLEGDDLIGCALISRISVNSPAELENQSTRF
jgi:hypothetical protein